ncbi:MAG: hypothetical protein ACD_81C00054G0005 [uncultured bacterium]|uniref:Uncharacterized protein n=1 Tax=Candidatus Wolfebacteria bacterium GW2011_GWE2_44_13 TaxID=1619017 RepID=A0A0G1JFZ7_9BACT|nr:MAG: hypothetical protein ACD_81C00054G0005 [uncultured bacterium]KKT42957.1 MAG: hypothetical protein UW32_C0003G0060 [Candidatus Wolfebacteria bacterium GW2011_GWE2_44_13]
MDDLKLNKLTKIAKMIDTNAYRLFILVFFVIVFSWPYMSFLEQVDYVVPFTYLFAVWGLCILVLMIGSRNKDDSNDSKNNG